jgi:CheY-like chemotaxis protein
MHTLLIAHPDHTHRELLAAQLDADGHTVHEADSAATATAKLCAHAIDVILADLGLPWSGSCASCAPGASDTRRVSRPARHHARLLR